MSISETFSGLLNGTGSASSNTYPNVGLSINSYVPGNFRHQYDHLNRVFYFEVGYATIIVPMEIAQCGGTYEVGSEWRRGRMAGVACESDPVGNDDHCTPDVADKKEVKNVAEPKVRKDLCSRFLYEK
jgi:hypothetical protein